MQYCIDVLHVDPHSTSDSIQCEYTVMEWAQWAVFNDVEEALDVVRAAARAKPSDVDASDAEAKVPEQLVVTEHQVHRTLLCKSQRHIGR